MRIMEKNKKGGAGALGTAVRFFSVGVRGVGVLLVVGWAPAWVGRCDRPRREPATRAGSDASCGPRHR